VIDFFLNLHFHLLTIKIFMHKFGLIGYPLSHSYSPKIHKLIYKLNDIDALYSLNEITSKSIKTNPLKNISKDHSGFNVTIPYKTEIIKYLDDISEEAKQIGAVNTLKKLNNKWFGFNTDIEGFLYPIQDSFHNVKTGLVIGTGGAAKAIVYAVLNYIQPHQLIILGRTKEKSEFIRDKFKIRFTSIEIVPDIISNIYKYLNRAELIVNATSIGMHPKVNDSVLPDSFVLKKKAIVYDLVYNPLETRFLKKAKEIYPTCTTINGIQMLIAQAVKSIEIWTGKKISIENTINALNKSKTLL